MAGQERKTLGDRIAERLMKRVQRRVRLGLSADFLARFGIADPWASSEGDAAGHDAGDDGMVFLSIKPYMARLRRLAWTRRRREQWLARITERHGARMERGAWRRWPGATATTSVAGLWGGGVGVLSAGEMHLPPPPPRAEAAPQAEVEQAPARGRARGPGARTSSSPWLITPFIPARVSRGRARSAQSEPQVVVVQAPGDRPAAGPRRSDRALDRVGARLASTSQAGSALTRAVEQAAPALARTARGRNLARELVEIAELPQEEQVIQVRRALRRAGAARRVVVEELDQALPQVETRPATIAAERLGAPAGQARVRGLRPVLASSPSMQALRGGGVAERAPVEATSPERPAAVAARRAVARDERGRLSASPVPRPSARVARSLSASPMSQGRSRAPAPAARRSVATSARLAQLRVGSATPTASAQGGRPQADATSSARPSRRAAASSDDGGGPAGGDEPAPGPAAQDPGGQPVARLAPRRASARAAERLSMGQEDADLALDGAEPDAARLGARASHSAGQSPARLARFAVARSPRGAFVPATTLARPEPDARSIEPDAVTPPGRPSTPTTAPRGERARGQGTAERPLPARATSSRHAADRAALPASMAGSVLPRVATSQAPTPGHPQVTVRGPRRLAVVRDGAGAFVPADPSAPVVATSARTDRPAAPARPSALALPARALAQDSASDAARDASPDATSDAAPSAVGWAARRMDAPASGGAEGRRPSLVPPPVTSLAARERSTASPSAEPTGSSTAVNQAPATPGRALRRRDAPVVAAAERQSRAPVVGLSVRRTAGLVPAEGSAEGTERAEQGSTWTVRTRSRPNPVAYAARFGLSSPDQVIIRVEQAEPPAPAASPRSTPPARPPAARATSLDRIDLRALATAEWATPVAAAAPGRAPRLATAAPAGVVLAPDDVRTAPAAADGPARRADAAPRRGTSPERRADGTWVPGTSSLPMAPTAWAGARTARTATGRSLRGPAAAGADRGGFDPLGVFRAPLLAERRGASTAPTASVARDFGLVQPGPARSNPGGGGGSRFGLPGASPATTPRQARPDLAVTLGAVDQGVTDRVLPTWAQRASGEPLIRAEGQFIDALARATEPEEILRVIYQRAARGNMTAAATGLPAPVIQVIEQIRAVADRVQLGAPTSVRGGPGSDAEVLRRSGVRAEAPRSTARVASGMTALRSRGSASRRDGVGADGISKLSKKLQQLILLAERQRQAARQQVRMAEDSASARAEGHASPGSGEGGIDKKIDIEALGREVLEVVSQELEMRKARSQEGSDEYGWW